MSREVYLAAAGLTKVDLTGRIFSTVFDLFGEAYRKALEESSVRRFDALQVGIMDSEEFENRANIATKIADRGEFDSVLVIAGERMKMVTTEVATSIMSKTVDPEERRFGFTMPALIALITQAWFRERRLAGSDVSNVLARLMHRAHALGSKNPLAAFHGKPEPLAGYFDETRNLPVATPLKRKDCSPICDGAAAVVLTAEPQAVRVAGLGSATETSSILDREELTRLEATTRAARLAYWRAGIADPRRLEGRVVEVHDAFNSLLPIGLTDLGLVDADEAVEALVGDLAADPVDPIENSVTGPRGSLPTNLSGGLKARGHPVGGTGLFQISENYLQLTQRFPNREAQVPGARIGISHSIGGPGNNNYVTILERADSGRTPDAVDPPKHSFESQERRSERRRARGLHGASATVQAATTIHVTGRGAEPVHVALLEIDGRRVFARMDHAARSDEAPEQVLAGSRVKLLVKGDGDTYFQIPQSRGLDLGRVVTAIRRRVGGG
jgi:acetyl-CoA acetyltransferase